MKIQDIFFLYIYLYIQEEIKRQEVGSKVNKYGKKEKRQ